MIRKALISALFAAVATTSAQAQSTPAELTVIPNMNLETIAPVLRNAGLAPQTVTINGEDSLVVPSGDVKLVFRPTVCNPDCAGLLMFSLFQGNAPSNLMNDFNSRTPPTAAYTAQGNTVLSRYLIADHGITTGSLMVNVMVFDNTVTKWLNDRSRTLARSVSVAEQNRIPSNFERETEDYLADMMSRRELYSGLNSHSESY
ncbi:MAG: YbjN domain-containing protein [Pseudomonadota bacterium]